MCRTFTATTSSTLGYVLQLPITAVTILFFCRASEGRTVEVPYRGDVELTILDILGGLRSTCTYVGAAKLKELSRRTTFIRVTQQHSQVFS